MYAAKGSGAWWQIGEQPPRRAQVSSVNELSEATFCLTNPARWLAIGKGDALETLLTSVQLARGWGDCYGHMLVATGRAEVMIDPAHVLAMLVYSGVGIVVFILAYKIIEKLLPFSLTKELSEDDNTAVGVLMGSVMIGLAIIIAASIAS